MRKYVLIFVALLLLMAGIGVLAYSYAVVQGNFIIVSLLCFIASNTLWEYAINPPKRKFRRR